MKRWVPLSVIFLAGLLAIVTAERQKIDQRPSPEAILSVVADGQHELTRIPSKLDRMSDEDEVRIGDELARSYETRWRPTATEDKAAVEVQAYLQQVGERVSLRSRRKLHYQFHYVPQLSFVNAFALPGGHVFVGAGLLTLMQSEDALAAVLGHEVEHVDLRHCAERVQTERRLRNLGPLGDLLGLPVELFIAGYSKDQELEADRDGTALAVEAGYSPLGILQLFKEFGRLEQKAGNHSNAPATPIDEATQLSMGTLQGYFASHPPSGQRTQQIEKLVKTEQWPAPPLRPLACRSVLPVSPFQPSLKSLRRFRRLRVLPV
jgi:beta-barrel assembly-enhancing protease